MPKAVMIPKFKSLYTKPVSNVFIDGYRRLLYLRSTCPLLTRSLLTWTPPKRGRVNISAFTEYHVISQQTGSDNEFCQISPQV